MTDLKVNRRLLLVGGVAGMFAASGCTGVIPEANAAENVSVDTAVHMVHGRPVRVVQVIGKHSFAPTLHGVLVLDKRGKPLLRMQGSGASSEQIIFTALSPLTAAGIIAHGAGGDITATSSARAASRSTAVSVSGKDGGLSQLHAAIERRHGAAVLRAFRSGDPVEVSSSVQLQHNGRLYRLT